MRRAVCFVLLFACAIAPFRAIAAPDDIERELTAPPLRSEYDGRDDDLLTAGLGVEGLRAALPPFANPLAPTVRELRRRAIWQNWRALIDVSADGGFGRDYGPRAGELIGGVEYLAAIRDPAGVAVTTVMLQIPRGFDLAQPCLIVVASSGSRGIYGALPTAAEWGLRRGCAVAHTDKGTGVGLWDVDRGIGVRIDGQLTRDPNDPLLGFAPSPGTAAALPPHTLLMKHANSAANPEAQWGRYMLRAGQLAFVWLNREYAARLPKPLAPANTMVIAAGISNGGGAALRALELDRSGFFDAGVAAEPSLSVERVAGEVSVQQGGVAQRFTARGLYDYASLHQLLQPCAVLAQLDPSAPFAGALALTRPLNEAWCADLARAGEVRGVDAAAQAADARAQLLDAGVHSDALRLGVLNLQFGLWPSVATTYAQAYSRSGATTPPCGLSFAATDAAGQPRAYTDLELAQAFSDINGIAPSGGVNIVRADPASGQRSVLAAALPQTARCLRGLRSSLPALQSGIAEIQMTARPGRRPVVILHGRGDGLVSVNHSSRAYVSANWRREHGRSATSSGATARDGLRYYEIRRAQHFDAFLPLPGMRGHYLPMQPLLNAAFDAVHARLIRGTPLPPSQAVTDALRAAPGADAILWRAGTLVIPD
jgi:hydroxybutyrate-dimer hydrolase